MIKLDILRKSEIDRLKKDVEDYELGKIPNPTHSFKLLLRAIKTIEQLEQQILFMSVKNNYVEPQNCVSEITDPGLIEINKVDHEANIDKSSTGDINEMCGHILKLLYGSGY